MIGVRYVGFLAENSGFGQATRLHLHSLARAGVPVCGRSVLMGPQAPGDVQVSAARYPATARLCAQRRAYDHVLLHVVPPAFPFFREPGCRNIGITVWDSTVLPAGWAEPLALVDEIWVPSRYAAISHQRPQGPPVRVIPHPVRVRAPRPDSASTVGRTRRAERSTFGIPDEQFVFLAIQEWSDRKNPLGVLAAFVDAFSGRNDVALLMKIGLRYVRDFRAVRQALDAVLRRHARRGAHPPVYVIAEELTGRSLNRLYQWADAYVSLHRSEGFGLCLAEAMAHGLPVVATGYSGNLDFMDDQSAFLVEHRVVPVRVELGPHDLWTRDMEWAEPRHDHAVTALRALLADKDRRCEVARRGQHRVLQELAPQRIGNLMRRALTQGSTATVECQAAGGPADQ